MSRSQFGSTMINPQLAERWQAVEFDHLLHLPSDARDAQRLPDIAGNYHDLNVLVLQVDVDSHVADVNMPRSSLEHDV